MEIEVTVKGCSGRNACADEIGGIVAATFQFKARFGSVDNARKGSVTGKLDLLVIRQSVIHKIGRTAACIPDAVAG